MAHGSSLAGHCLDGAGWHNGCKGGAAGGRWWGEPWGRAREPPNLVSELSAAKPIKHSLANLLEARSEEKFPMGLGGFRLATGPART